MGKQLGEIKFKDIFVGMPVERDGEKGKIVYKGTSATLNYATVEREDGHVHIEFGNKDAEYMYNSDWSFDSQKG